MQRSGRRVGQLLGLGAIAASGVVVGAFHDPVEARLGPHEVEATATLDTYLTADFGPFDSIDIPLDAPLGLGVDVVVKGNNKDEIKVEDYARFLSDPSDDIEELQNAFKDQALKHTAFALAGFFALRLTLGEEGMKIARNRLSISKAPHIAGALLLGGGAILVGSSVAESSYKTPVDEVFNGTILEGARVNGPVMDKFINELAPEIFGLIKENDAFYAKVGSNLSEAAEQQSILTSGENLQTTLFYTDSHCNLGMASVIGELEDITGANVLFDGGDTTMGGTEFEAQCLAVIADQTDSPIVFSAGNHDSQITESQAKNRGFVVLDGEVERINGLRILGDSDPRRSEFTKAINQVGSEDQQAAGQRLAEQACRPDNTVDVLLIHDEELAKDSLEQGCAVIALSGHTHKYSTTVFESGSLQLTGGSVGGKAASASTFGPLKAPGVLYVLQFDKSTSSYIRHQQVTINPDASVEIGSPTLYGPTN